MARMLFNQFQKELVNRGIDGQVAFMLTVVYEQLIDLAQQQEEMAKLMVTFADGVSKVISMQQADQKHLGALIKKVGSHGKEDGVSVETVAHDPNEFGRKK